MCSRVPESVGVVFLRRQEGSAAGDGRVSPAPTDATCTVNSCMPVPAIVGKMMLEVILGTVKK